MSDSSHPDAAARRAHRAHLDPQDRRQRRAAVRPAVARGYLAALDARARGVDPVAARRAGAVPRDDSRQRVALDACCWARSTSRCRSARWPSRTWSRRSSTTFCRRTSAATSSAFATRAPHAGSKTTRDDDRARRPRDRAAGPGLRRGASGATITARGSETHRPDRPGRALGGCSPARWSGRPGDALPARRRGLLRPLSAIHQEWVEERHRAADAALAKFRDAKGALLNGFIGVGPRAGHARGLLRRRSRRLCTSGRRSSTSPIVVPLSFIVQMLPVSVNGFGVREATFGYYFTRFGVPLESALALSFIGAALIMLFSVSGAVVVSHPPPRPAGGGAAGSSPGGPYMNLNCMNAPR